MIKFNYILNDLALSNLITKCLCSENANYYDKEELENQIKLIQQENQKYKEVIDDYKEDISNLLDIIGKNCNELKCTSDEWLVIQKYQGKEVSE